MDRVDGSGAGRGEVNLDGLSVRIRTSGTGIGEREHDAYLESRPTSAPTTTPSGLSGCATPSQSVGCHGTATMSHFMLQGPSHDGRELRQKPGSKAGGRQRLSRRASKRLTKGPARRRHRWPSPNTQGGQGTVECRSRHRLSPEPKAQDLVVREEEPCPM
jgi:hypothetical protein